jgi:hypothetical protein
MPKTYYEEKKENGTISRQVLEKTSIPMLDFVGQPESRTLTIFFSI